MKVGMRKSVIAGLTAFGVAVTAGVAYAVISANIVSPTADTGQGTGYGGNSCQSGNTVTFTWPDPTWDNSTGNYVVNTLAYSGITNSCVTLATADLTVNVVLSGQQTSAANATASNMSTASGTLTLSTAIPFSDATNASVRFFIKNA